MTGDAFLTLALQWVPPSVASATEALCRSATSRSYYGVFNMARDLLRRADIHFKSTDNPHQKIPQYFMGCGDDDAYEVGSMLGDLLQARKDADYELRKPVGTLVNARLHVASACEIRGKLDHLSEDSKFEEISPGLEAYRKMRS